MTSFPNRDCAIALMGHDPRTAAADKSFLSIDIVGEVTEALADAIIGQLRASPRANTIWMSITSEGGDEAAGWRIYNAVRRHGARKKIATGRRQVASAAVLILASADVRRAMPGTSILLHAVEREPHSYARWTADNYAAHSATLRAKDERFSAELAARCGKPASVFMARLSDEKPTPLAEALGLGLIHEIIGHSEPLSRDWPAKARAALAHGDPRIYGAAGYKFSEQYLRASALS